MKLISIILFATLLFSCKEKPTNSSPDLTSPSYILSYFSKNDTFIYYRSISESNGMDQTKNESSSDIWRLDSVAHNTTNNSIKAFFEIEVNTKIEFGTCESINFEFCSYETEEHSYQAIASYTFDIDNNKIILELPTELLGSSYLSDAYKPTEIRLYLGL